MTAQPPRIELAVYDLLPDSRLATSFWWLGVGLYHTAIRIPDLEVEFAYGGLAPTAESARNRHNVTGIFSIPSPEDPTVVERLMPGLRFVERRDLGGSIKARKSDFAGETRNQGKPLPSIPRGPQGRMRLVRETSSSNTSLSGTPLLRQASSGDDSMFDADSSLDADQWGRKLRPASGISSDIVSSPDSYGRSPFADPAEHDNAEEDNGPDQGPINHLGRILAVIEEMKAEPQWRARNYGLLTKNCNHFSDELCRRLTGRPAPAWINRAAWVGLRLPCLVPQDWLEPPTADEIEDAQYSPPSRQEDRRSEASTPPRVAHFPSRGGIESSSVARPTSPLVAIPYIETRPMHISVGMEGIATAPSGS